MFGAAVAGTGRGISKHKLQVPGLYRQTGVTIPGEHSLCDLRWGREERGVGAGVQRKW